MTGSQVRILFAAPSFLNTINWLSATRFALAFRFLPITIILQFFRLLPPKLIDANEQKRRHQSAVVSRLKSRPLSARKSPKTKMAVSDQSAERQGLLVSRYR